MNTTTYNVDPQEVAKFNALAAHWWDADGELKTLHDINPVRLDYIAKRVNGLQGKTVLDVACGGGLLSEGLAQRGAIVTGIDMGEMPLSVAKLHLYESELNIDYQHISVEALSEQRPASFDIVTCMEMLEHVPDPLSIIAACQQLVKPGGDVFFSTINRNPKSYLLAIIGAEYLLRLLPRGSHDYAKFIRPAELSEWARMVGLQTHNISGIQYNPIARYAWLSRDVSINYLIHTKNML